MELPLLITISIIVGLVVGGLSGMLGIGGGTLLVPLFKLGFGLPPIECTATSLFTIIPTSISGATTHVRGKTCIPRLGIAAGVGGAATSWLGVWLASLSPDWAIMAVAAAVIAYSSFTMLHKAIKMGKGVGEDKKSGARARASANADASATSAPAASAELAADAPAGDAAISLRPSRYGLREVLLCAAIGASAGILSGYVGVGGGFIMVPFMMQLLDTPMRLTSGTSLIAVMILAVPGVITQGIFGNVNWIVGIFVAAGSIPGAILGSTLMKRVPECALRFIFSAFLFVAAALLILEQLKII